MKLVIQIPCLDEAGTLPLTLADLPREVAGFSAVAWLVVDDGSRDSTRDVARAHGADHVVGLPAPGLAAAYSAGLRAALALGADVVLNTDGDHQYRGADIGALVAPVLRGEADLAVGHREQRPAEALQRLGSWVVGRRAGLPVPDATCGFRALSRRAALALGDCGGFTFTSPTLVRAGRGGLRVAWVPVRTNAPTRPSRLASSPWAYVRRATPQILGRPVA